MIKNDKYYYETAASSDKIKIEAALKNFQTPGKYLGIERNSYRIKKDAVKFLHCFPDDYTIGMSSLGYHTVANIINSHPSFGCERCFAPALDMEKWMRENDVELFSLETKSPAKSFDILGFSIHYEMSLTNLVNIISLSGIEVFRKKRNSPLFLMGGGPTVVNPAILSEFLDLIIIGEAEIALPELLNTYLTYSDKDEFLYKASFIEGVYVPSKNNETKLTIFKEFDNRYYPVCSPVPLVDIPHNRINIEINRGCRSRCKFCQATVIYSPYREKKPKEILDIAVQSVACTGFEEIALTSLSAFDYTELLNVMDDLYFALRDIGVSVVMSSIRLSGKKSEHLFESICNRLIRLKKGGLTFAPETPSERLKKIIGKNIKNSDIIKVSEIAAERGWKKIKLYFMLGLPGETEEDVKEIGLFIKKIKKISGLRVNVSLNAMIPQPHTPFQWLNNISPDILSERIEIVRRMCPKEIKKFDAEKHILGSILVRADKNFSEVIYAAYKKGARFDQWDEHFNFNIWKEAFKECGSSWEEYYFNDFRNMDEFPWDIVKVFISKKELKDSFEHSMKMVGS